MSDITRLLADSQPFAGDLSLYCTICGAIQGAGDRHKRSCAWWRARRSLGLDTDWPEPTDEPTEGRFVAGETTTFSNWIPDGRPTDEPTEADPQLAELRELEKAATPGPWGWRGNDDGLVELRGHGPFGAYDGRVISAQRAEPCMATRSDGEVALTAEACDSCKEKWAEMLEQGHTDMWEDYRCPKPENLATVWLKGKAGIEPANTWAVRERPYRSDVASVDHPDAKLIAAARNALPSLLDEIDRLRALVGGRSADRCFVVPETGSVLHRYACDFGPDCPAPGGRSAAPTRDELAEAIAEVLSNAWMTNASTADKAGAECADAVMALLSRSAAEPPAHDETCWLCGGLGGVAVHNDASEAFGRRLLIAHAPESKSHPVYPCPVRGVAAEPNEEATDGR